MKSVYNLVYFKKVVLINQGMHKTYLSLFSFSIVLFYIIFLQSLSVACAQNSPPIVKIGVIAPLTGGSATIGKEMTRTLNLLSQVLKSKSEKYVYEFIFEDGKAAVDSSPTTAVQKLANSDAVKFFIVATSGEVMQIGPLAERYDLFIIATYATIPDVKNLGERVYRTSIDVDRGADTLANFLRDMADLPLALLTETHAFTSGVSASLRSRLANQIIADEEYPLDESDLKTVLLKARAKHPKSYYFSCARPSTCALITNQARQLGIKEQFYSFLHMSDPDYLKATQKRSNGIIFLSPPEDVSRSPEFISFKKKYFEHYVDGPMNDFLMRSTYDAADSLISSIYAVGPSPQEVSSFLQTFEKEGALGHISFDKNREIKDQNYEIRQVVDGIIKTIK